MATELKPCPFCKTYYHANNSSRSGKTKTKYLAALVQETYYNGKFCGTSSYQPEALNYCPNCGAEMKGGIA